MGDPRDVPELTEAFTLVFEGDIRQFDFNPLKTDTPFGRPYAVSMGDALAKIDKLMTEADENAAAWRDFAEYSDRT
jgi:hypothetical protein